MNRRDTCLALLPLVAFDARAQQPGRIYRVGWLSRLPKNPTTGSMWDQAMTRLGWVVGQNLVTGLEAVRRAKADALMTLEDPLVYSLRPVIVGFAAEARLPAIYGLEGYVEIGGLMSYHIRIEEFMRLSAYYVDKILKGAKPADLPVQQPTNFSLAINLHTAKALNLTIPPALLAMAAQLVG